VGKLLGSSGFSDFNLLVQGKKREAILNQETLAFSTLKTSLRDVPFAELCR
jgi:hypothetical protein